MSMGHHHQLDRQRVISAYAVVALHVCAFYVTGAPVGGAAWWAANIIDSALRWCVPFFVMITGALLLPKLESGVSLRAFYWRRAALLVPFAFWIGAYLAYHAIAKNLLLGGVYDIGAAIAALWYQPPHYHLWYLYMIVPLLLLAPLLARLKPLGLWAGLLLLLPAALWFLQLSGDLPRTPLLLRFLEFMGYLLAGHWLFRARQSKAIRLAALLAIAAWGFIAYFTQQHCLQSACRFSPYYDYHGPLVVVLSLSLFVIALSCLPNHQSRVTALLNPLALGIFLIHPVFIDLGFALMPPESAPLWALPLMMLAAAGLSTAAAWVLSRIPYLRRVIQLR